MTDVIEIRPVFTERVIRLRGVILEVVTPSAPWFRVRDAVTGPGKVEKGNTKDAEDSIRETLRDDEPRVSVENRVLSENAPLD